MESKQKPAPARGIRATVLLAEVAAVERLGFIDGVRRHATPALRQLLDHPPLSTKMVPGEVMDDLYTAIATTSGRSAIVRVIHDALRVQLGPLLRPLIESTQAMYGSGPAVLFSNFNSFAAPLMQGYSFEWQPESPRSGVVTVRADTRPNPLTFAVWEGVVSYFVEMSGERPAIETTRLQADGREGAIHISW